MPLLLVNIYSWIHYTNYPSWCRLVLYSMTDERQINKCYSKLRQVTYNLRCMPFADCFEMNIVKWVGICKRFLDTCATISTNLAFVLIFSPCLSKRLDQHMNYQFIIQYCTLCELPCDWVHGILSRTERAVLVWFYNSLVHILMMPRHWWRWISDGISQILDAIQSEVALCSQVH